VSAASPSAEATIVLDAEGRYVDASPLALELLGVDLPTLLTKQPADFRDPGSPPTDEARRAELIAALPRGLAGVTTIRRADGATFRARFTIGPHPDRPGFMIATIEPIAARVAAPPVVRTLPEVLEAWRQADREVAAFDPGTREWRAARVRLVEARDMYQRLSRLRRG
jgi:PAS domain S-box-containing protein